MGTADVTDQEFPRGREGEGEGSFPGLSHSPASETPPSSPNPASPSLFETGEAEVAQEESETVAVSFEITQLERVAGKGRLVGLACVRLEVAGIELTLQGVSVFREADGGRSVVAPRFRHPSSGQWLPAVLLPRPLTDAISAELLAEGAS